MFRSVKLGIQASDIKMISWLHQFATTAAACGWPGSSAVPVLADQRGAVKPGRVFSGYLFAELPKLGQVALHFQPTQRQSGFVGEEVEDFGVQAASVALGVPAHRGPRWTDARSGVPTGGIEGQCVPRAKFCPVC